MATTYVAVKRRGKKTWVVGAITDNLDFVGKAVDLSGTSQISLTESVEAVHTKDSMGGNAATSYMNRSLTGNIALVYTPGEKPRAGDIVVYTDPDDEDKRKALQIVTVGVESNNGGTSAMMPVSVEWFEAWGDDEEVIAGDVDKTEVVPA